MSEEGTVRQPAEEKFQHRSARRGAHPAQSQAGQRDPQLDRGQKIIQLGAQAGEWASAGLTPGEELLDTSFAHADEGKLRRNEEAVGQDQDGDGYAAEESPLEHLSASVTGDSPSGRLRDLPSRQRRDL